MFGLLNPALTPLKTKITLVAVGLLLLLLVGSLASNGVLFRQWQGARQEVGLLQGKVAEKNALIIENARIWDEAALEFRRQLQIKDRLKAVAEQAAADAQLREQTYNRKLAAALKKLKEATDATAESREWAVVPVPDPVVRGMCDAARAALGAGESCHGNQDGDREDPGVPADPVPDRSPT